MKKLTMCLMAVALVMATGLRGANDNLEAVSQEFRKAVSVAGGVAFNHALSAAATKAVPGLNPLEARTAAALVQSLTYNLGDTSKVAGRTATLAVRVALVDAVQHQIEQRVCSNQTGSTIMATLAVGTVERVLSDHFAQSKTTGTMRVEEAISNPANLLLVVATAVVGDVAYRLWKGTLPFVSKKQVQPSPQPVSVARK